MKSFLFVCSKYSQNSSNPYLTDIIVSKLREKGHHVSVLGVGDIEFYNELDFPFDYLYKVENKFGALKYIFLWFGSILKFYKNNRVREFDFIIFFAPLIVFTPIVYVITFLFKSSKKICVIFDFFPSHQVQIGLIPKIFEKPFKFLETLLLSKFDILTGMSPNNISMINKYYGIEKLEKIQVKLLPLWTTKIRELKPQLDISNDSKTFNLIFGGQIVPGRNIEVLLNFILNVNKNNSINLKLTIYSWGEEFERLKILYSDFTSIEFRQRVNKELYLKRLSEFDLGIIVTNPDVTFPTFPSKILDYLNCGLPCLAFIEKASDLSAMFKNEDFVLVNNFDFNIFQENKIIDFIRKSRINRIQNLVKLDEIFYVEHTIKTLLKF